MWLNRAQLIARKGREMTKESEVDEALNRPGQWGCLAVDRYVSSILGSGVKTEVFI